MSARRGGTRARSLGSTLALATCMACAGVTSQDPFRGETGGFASEPVLVTVRNDDFRDATVYVDWTGIRERLGMVTGKTSETFSTPWKSERLRFHVDFVGGGEYVSELVDVYDGDHLDFVILPGW